MGVCFTHIGAPCCETWLKFEVKVRLRREKREKKIRDFYLLGSYPLVGRHVVNEMKVGCYVVNELEVS